MGFLGNNYLHILHMKNIALDILCKVNSSSSSTMEYFNFHKCIPLLVPLLRSISIIFFNLFEMLLYYLFPWLRYLNNFISNSILLIKKLIELLFFFFIVMYH
jgi:hypothetical protein